MDCSVLGHVRVWGHILDDPQSVQLRNITTTTIRTTTFSAADAPLISMYHAFVVCLSFYSDVYPDSFVSFYVY